MKFKISKYLKYLKCKKGESRGVYGSGLCPTRTQPDISAQPGLNSTLSGGEDFDLQPTRRKFQINQVGSYRFSSVNRSVLGSLIHWFLAEIWPDLKRVG